MRFQTLSQWLQWQERLHFTEIDPGLDRVGEVWRLLGGKTTLPFTVITVAGTNGKGSSVAMLEVILRQAGYRTGTYTSPHLLRYNERICINGCPSNDNTICAAFDRIDKARGVISLTYFEYATLAAVDIFSQSNLDIVILEVGMGGRLDAVNLFNADISLITPIGLDHTAWLGNNREDIGREKAGIIRAYHPVVCAETLPPQSVIDRATELSAPLYVANRDFQFHRQQDDWSWKNKDIHYEQVSIPSLKGSYQIQNAAAVLQVISLLNNSDFIITLDDINKGLENIRLAGRFQIIDGDIKLIFDVTHNQQGATNLAKLLTENPCDGCTYVVLAMLKDKDAKAVAEQLKNQIDRWYLAGLDGSRGMTSEQLATKLATVVSSSKVTQHQTVVDAYKDAMADAKQGDRLLIFGSFHTVEAVMRQIPEMLELPK